jgi:hypothetical protein
VRLCWLLLGLWASLAWAYVPIDNDLGLKIGVKIWHNESGGRVSGLTSWGKGEHFASLGIGHFIWYPKGHEAVYGESFADLLHYFERQGVTLPIWLRGKAGRYSPWASRQTFMADFHGEKLVALRHLLTETIPLQLRYMMMRLEHAFPRILSEVPSSERPFVEKTLAAMMQSPQGVYALVDYVNFKGAGLGHRGKDWGLLHVLRQMHKAPADLSLLEAFVWSADVVLARRVAAAPKQSHEARWLLGWRKRVYGYL